MKNSEKQLLIALAACLGVFVGVPFVWRTVAGPVVELQKDVDKAGDDIKKQNDLFDLGRARLTAMAVYKEQSLSSHASQGALAYQQWLTDLAEIVGGFSEPKVEPDRISAPKNKPYVIVRMSIKGESTLEQVRTFLYRFHRANVLHRMVSLKLDAQNNSSSPRVAVTIMTEALSLKSAEVKGATLFPRSSVATVSKDQAALITLAETDGFPKEAPFEVRIGADYHQVVAISDDGWQLEVADGEDLSVSVDDKIEYSPVHPDYTDATEEQFAALIEKNPFAKPAPYRPRLDLVGDKSVVHGSTLNLTAKASGFDLKAGAPDFSAISELPAGMTLEGDKLTWAPPTELEAAEYKVTIRTTAAGLREPLESEFTLTLRKVNKAPELEVPGELVAVLGQAMTFSVSGSDEETAADALRYSLGSGAPEGAALNETTGEFTWTPSPEMNPGIVNIPIQVVDDGDPAQTTTVQAAVNVQDDRAMFTYLTGSVATNNVREAWLTDRSTDTRVDLFEGGQLQYAGFDALVLTIGDDFVLLQQENDTLRIDLGDTLREAIVIASLEPEPEPTETEEPAEPVGATTESEAAEPAAETTEPVAASNPVEDAAAPNEGNDDSDTVEEQPAE